jgi:probable H4MPT-linked C1 transfer pathway protein
VSQFVPGNAKLVGVDIGGANLKYCDTNGIASSTSFPLWQSPELLADRLAKDLSRFTSIDELAITMTGELADCFLDRAHGVKWIVDHALEAAARIRAREVRFYGTDGEFREAPDAKANPDVVAAANWHALASYAAKAVPDATTVIDVGSTTTDIIPIAEGSVSTSARTDFERLVEGSLVYVGCRRTPVCSLVSQLSYRGQACPVMNEVFATMDDALLILGSTTEDESDLNSADRQPRTVRCAANRMARMLGLDQRCVSTVDAREMAQEVVTAAKGRVSAAIRRIHRSGTVLIAGHGQELLGFDPGTRVQQLSDELGRSVTRCAPSYAVAMLYRWQVPDAGIRCGG